MSNSLQPHGLRPNQVPLSLGFPRQEYWNGLPFPTPEDLPNLRIKLVPLKSPALARGLPLRLLMDREAWVRQSMGSQRVGHD